MANAHLGVLCGLVPIDHLVRSYLALSPRFTVPNGLTGGRSACPIQCRELDDHRVPEHTATQVVDILPQRPCQALKC